MVRSSPACTGNTQYRQRSSHSIHTVLQLPVGVTTFHWRVMGSPQMHHPPTQCTTAQTVHRPSPPDRPFPPDRPSPTTQSEPQPTWLSTAWGAAGAGGGGGGWGRAGAAAAGAVGSGRAAGGHCRGTAGGQEELTCITPSLHDGDAAAVEGKLTSRAVDGCAACGAACGASEADVVAARPAKMAAAVALSLLLALNSSDRMPS
jgi:hypothetical protein